jgi:hypothetical protein
MASDTSYFEEVAKDFFACLSTRDTDTTKSSYGMIVTENPDIFSSEFKTGGWASPPNSIAVAMSADSAKILHLVQTAFAVGLEQASGTCSGMLPVAIDFNPVQLGILCSSTEHFPEVPAQEVIRLDKETVDRDIWKIGSENDQITVYSNRVELQIDCGAAGIACFLLDSDALSAIARCKADATPRPGMCP